jgi:lipopolysaccharide biosynthesis glycosyltransferase
MFVSICDKEYLIGFEVMVKSLIDNNPRVKEENIPFCIISNELTDDDLVVVKKIHENISIKNYDERKYHQIEELKSKHVGFGDYTKYELFSIEGVDKIIFLDCDVVILGNIDYLLDFKNDFGAVHELYIDQYNTGVMVITKEFLSEKITSDLINLTLIYGITEHFDQDIINYYFEDIITPIPIGYNFLKIYHKEIFQNTGLPKYVKILHYVVKKPWQNRNLVLLEEGTLWQEKYWFDYYSKILKLK